MFNREDDIYDLDLEEYVERGLESLAGRYSGCVSKVNWR